MAAVYTENLTRETSATLIEAIAAELGGTAYGHTPDAGNHWKTDGYILLDGATDPKQGPALYISIGGYGSDGKLAVYGEYPKDEHGNRSKWDQPKPIRISADKTPAQIAKDITRRMLTEYRAEHAACLEKIQQWNAAIDAQAAARDRLAAILPASRVSNGPYYMKDAEKNGNLHYYHNAGLTIDAKVSGDGLTMYEFKVHRLTVDEAERVLHLLAEIDAAR